MSGASLDRKERKDRGERTSRWHGRRDRCWGPSTKRSGPGTRGEAPPPAAARASRLLLGAVCALGAAASLGCERELAVPEPGDRTPPSLSQFSVSPRFAKAGAAVVLSLQSTKPLSSATSTFGSAPAPCTVAGQGATCTAAVPQAGGSGSSPVGEGDLSFSVTVVDRSGLVTTAFGAAVVTLDFTPPLLIASVSPSPAVLGGPVTFVVDASEPLGAAPAIAADFLVGVPVCAGAGSRYSCTGATIATSTAVGPHTFVATGIDRAGNGATSSLARVDVQSPLALSQFRVDREIAAEGDVVTLVFQSNRPLARASSTFAGATAACAVQGSSASCSVQIPSQGASGLGDGEQAFAVTAVDGQGILATAQGVGAVRIDSTPPLLVVTESPNPAQLGGLVTFVVDATEPLGAPPSIAASFLAGVPVCSGAVPGTRFSCAGARVATSTSLGPHTFTATGADLAGNGASSYPVQLEVESPLSFAAFGVEPASRVAKAGDRVRLSVQANRTLTRATSTLGNLVLACSVFGSTATCEATVPSRSPPGFDDGDRTLDVTLVDFAGIAATAPGAATVRLDYKPPLLVVAESPSPAFRGAPTAFLVDSNEPLREAPVLLAPYLDKAPVCVGALPGSRFVCAGSAISTLAPLGLQSYWVTGTDIAGNGGTSSSGTVRLEDPPLPVPTISVGRVAPSSTRADRTVTFRVSADQPMTSCAASVAGLYAACGKPNGNGCDCSFRAPTTIGDGPAIVLGYGTSAFGTGVGSAALQVDVTPPRFTLATGATSSPLLGAIRRRVGLTDRAFVGTSSVFDSGGSDYAGRGLAAVLVWASSTPSPGEQPLAVLSAVSSSVSGSISGEADLPGTEGWSDTSTSPGLLWFSALDAVDNESERVAGALGAASPPHSTGALATIVRRPVGQLDSVFGRPGTLLRTACALRGAAVFEATYADLPYAVGAANDDGSFPELPLGSATSAPERLFVAAIDKCTPMSAPPGPQYSGEIGDGEDARPTLDTNLVTIVRRPIGQLDSVLGAAGAGRSSACALLSISAHTTGLYVDQDLGERPVAPDGSFLELPFGSGTSSYASICVRLVDKCGQTASCAEPRWGIDTGAAIDSTRLRLVLHAVGAGVGSSTIEGAPGAVMGPVSAPTSLQLRDAGGRPLGPAYDAAVLGGDGSFPQLEVGDAATAFATLDVVDKANVLVSAVVANVSGSIDLGGHVPRAGSTNHAALHAFATQLPAALGPLEPPGFGPGLGAAVCAEAGVEAIGLVDRSDGQDLVTVATSVPVAASPGLQWSRLPYPNARYAAALAHVPGATVLYGGFNAGDAHTWRYAAQRWEQVATAHRPEAVGNGAMAWDGARLLFFGGEGSDGTLYGRTWLFDGADWSSTTTPSAPSPRSRPAIAATSSGLYLFGGFSSVPTNDLWRWDGAAWTLVSATSSPEPRAGAGFTWDGGHRLLLFGGVGSGDFYLDDTWSYDLDTGAWQRLATSTTPPQTREAHLVWDSMRGVAVLVQRSASDVWELSGGDWRSVTSTILPRGDVSVAWDPDVGLALLFGGNDYNRDDPDQGGLTPDQDYPHYAELLGWDGGEWLPLSLSPPGLEGHSATFDAADGRLLLFGGSMKANGHTLTSATWSHGAGGWTLLSPTTTPQPLRDAGLAWGETTGRTTLATGSGFTRLLDGTILFEGGDWVQHSYSDPQAKRSRAALAYDPARDRTVLFGGLDDFGSLLDDTWEFDGATWLKVAAFPRPDARSGHALVYDPIRSALVLVGGVGPSGPLSDVWTFDGAGWTQDLGLSPGPVAPTATAAFVPAAEGVVLVGARIANGPAQDYLLTLGLATPLATGPAPGPSARTGGTATWDPIGQRLLLVGGAAPAGGPIYSETWALSSLGVATTTGQRAIQLFSFPSRPGATATHLGALWVGSSSHGAKMAAWSWADRVWVELADVPASAIDEPVLATAVGNLADYVAGGRIWIALYTPDTTTAGAEAVELRTDYLRIDVDLSVPY